MNEQLIKYFSGTLSSDEKLELIKKFENDDQLRSDFLYLQNLNSVTQLLPRSSDRVDGRNNYKTFYKNLKYRVNKKLVVNIFKVAAIALILIATSVWCTLHFTNSTESGTNTLQVPAGQRAHITLHDGTEVWINAKSTLTYPSLFSSNTREVNIIGEAFFDVAEDNKRPFIVNTKNTKMKVLGTKFNVYSYPDTDYIQTALVEGALEVSIQSDNQKSILLSPNEQVTVYDNQFLIEEIQNPDQLLWRDGIYCFNNEKLINIIEKLELYYDVKIIVEDPDIFDIRYTGKFRQRDGIEEILRILQKIQPFKIERDRERNIIKLL